MNLTKCDKCDTIIADKRGSFFMQDKLTNLGNEEFLKSCYFQYMQAYPNANFVMIDLKLFKKLNDNYGHEMGDRCLKIFSKYLEVKFKDSIVVRIHGDEFSIITKYNENKINSLLKEIDNAIGMAVEQDIIPFKFGFNAGTARLESDYDLTKDKADTMMYYAKRNDSLYQKYSDDIYQKKIDKNEFLKVFDANLEDDNFSYYGRSLHDVLGQEQKMIQIYTRDINGNQILSGESYDILRKNSEISRFDMANLEKLVHKLCKMRDSNRYFITVDYKSLYSLNALAPFLILDDNINNVVLSVDMSGIETSEYDFTIDSICTLKGLLHKVRLDKIDNKIAPYLIEKINPEFVKIDTLSWKETLNDKKKCNILKKELELIKAMNDKTRIIFEMVENKDEHDYLSDISFNDTLL